MGKPLDIPSKLFGLFTFEDAAILGGFLFVDLFFLLRFSKVVGFFPSMFVCSTAFLGVFTFFFLKNTWPAGIIPAFFKYLSRPKLLLPGREKNTIPEK